MQTAGPPAADALQAVTAWVAELAWEQLPQEVRAQGVRSFVNIVGCTVAGSAHPLLQTLEQVLLPLAGPPTSTVIGRSRRTDALTATLLNCTSSGVHTFDDTHAQAVVHGSGPVASALLALAETRPCTGRELLLAFCAGLEATYRLGKALAVAPAEGDLRWLQTALTAPFGVALAAGHLLAFDADRLNAAATIALAQATGLRSSMGQSWARVAPAEAAQFGLKAALYAAQGLCGGAQALEGSNGFATAFSPRPHLAWLAGDLGQRWEILANTFKPYPSGVVINPVIDACLALHDRLRASGQRLREIEVTVNPVAIRLTDRPQPQDPLAAQVSLQHWAAVALLDGAAGLPQLEARRISDPEVVALRGRVRLLPDPAMAASAARVRVALEDGSARSQEVTASLGSAERPMSDQDIDRKCRTLGAGVLGPASAEALLRLCRGIDRLPDAGLIARSAAVPA